MINIFPKRLVYRRLRHKLSRPQRVKSLTTGIGFVCSDGLVICADRQMSCTDFKFYERKINQYFMGQGATILTFAGSPETMNTFCESFTKRSAITLQGTDEIRAHVRSTLDHVLPRKTSENFQMLCGIFVENEPPVLIKTLNRQLSPVFQSDFIGFGDSALVRYLQGTLLGNRRLCRSEAAVYGIYIVEQAKKYMQNCGGQTDVSSLTLQGQVSELDVSIASAMEQHLRRLEGNVSHLLATAFGSHNPDSDIAKSLETTGRVISDIRPWLNVFKPSTSQTSKPEP